MRKPILLVSALAILSLAIVAGSRYQGHWIIYLGFSLVANALLLNGFRRRAIYFDTFIGIFLWLGFWLKFSVRVAFTSGLFREPVGAFDFSGSSFDKALIVSSCGIAAFLFASFVREQFFVYPDEPPSCIRSGLFHFYKAFRKYFVSVFILVVVAVAASNAWLGIYQRGMVAQTILPFGLNGVFKWLLQFGLASVSALIIRFELELNRNISAMAVIPPILECFFSNVSLLSRGMILNASALAIGCLRLISAMKVSVRRVASIAAVAAIASFFIASLVAVNYLRVLKFDDAGASVAVAVSAGAGSVSPLLVDRWVGIEGVLAVSSSEKLGWELWREAWQEKYYEDQFSLYDQLFVSSHYASSPIDKSRNHFVNLPGLVAFLYYPGSLLFLVIAVLAAALVGAVFEVSTYRLCSGNWILCALVAQVIAFRLASFGYVPAQSHLLFGTLLMNILIIAAVDWVLRRHYLSPGVETT
jgi:hypothetical protein